jgi:hypothetical protein
MVAYISSIFKQKRISALLMKWLIYCHNDLPTMNFCTNREHLLEFSSDLTYNHI